MVDDFTELEATLERNGVARPYKRIGKPATAEQIAAAMIARVEAEEIELLNEQAPHKDTVAFYSYLLRDMVGGTDRVERYEKLDATDIDYRCAQMAYIQLTLCGIPATVRRGNSLNPQETDRTYPTITYAMNHKLPPCPVCGCNERVETASGRCSECGSDPVKGPSLVKEREPVQVSTETAQTLSSLGSLSGFGL